MLVIAIYSVFFWPFPPVLLLNRMDFFFYLLVFVLGIWELIYFRHHYCSAALVIVLFFVFVTYCYYVVNLVVVIIIIFFQISMLEKYVTLGPGLYCRADMQKLGIS